MANTTIKITLSQPGPPGAVGPAGPPSAIITQTTEPTGQSDGAMWYNPDTEDIKVQKNNAWVRLVDEIMLASDNETLILNGGYF